MITAYNQDVQRYMQGNRLSTKRKTSIIENIEKVISDAGKSFSRMFPPRSKRKEVLDHIIYLLSGNGICKISSTTLAKKVDCSVRTVSAAVKELKDTGEVLVCGLADGKNKYVFVLKSHENFKSIIEDVFHIDSNKIAEHITEQIAEQKNAESVGAVSVDDEKSHSNNYNSNILKQEKNNIRESIEFDLKSSSSTTITKKEMEQVNTYFTNEYQFNLYHNIKGGLYTPDMKLNAAVIALRLGSNCTLENYKSALKVAFKIDRFISNGGKIDSIPAYFSNMYETEIKIAIHDETHKKEQITKAPKFYNWLEN